MRRTIQYQLSPVQFSSAMTYMVLLEVLSLFS